ncbi:multicopper oxidase domain-containing protein [Gloeobacter kilaueensis]|uniref:Multicopper oxidase type 3 n=1 Tax=Gloeobacter kilaueensis (strain ATCC BAA-2537 / CCAP 1431/1 / ULC 316 / JS1) TaxID=1183438 RepID=U5QPS1_GLOK1|nr:multicopper oxidase domain-containing protein [Gloeobacter kilaueensis]AGY59624.1 multicopper oxidase type 3 [Gloeobacter kilaueensis JS1]
MFSPRRFIFVVCLGAFLGTGWMVAAAKTVPDRAQVREYWIAVESERWNVASHPDEQSGQRIAPEQATFNALHLRAYSPGFGVALPADPALGLAGPTIEATVGDTVIVHFKNLDNYYRQPHSLHPHGLQYSDAMDGSYMRSHPDKPGTAVPFGETFTYTWKAAADSVGAWAYHDHSVQPERNAALGMYGAIRVYDPKTRRPDREFFVFLTGLEAPTSGLGRDFDLINGLAYAGNTPTLVAKRGELVRFNVLALGTEFHTFHIHGYRWIEDGRSEDTHPIGPASSWSVAIRADNPGMWMYHCHVDQHLQNGMMGMFHVL